MAPIKDIDEEELDSKIDASLDKMYSRIDSLEKGGRTLERRIDSRLKDFDAPDVDIDDVGDISKLRSRLSRLKDLDSHLEEEKPVSEKKSTVKSDKLDAFAQVVTEEKKGETDTVTPEEGTGEEPKEKKKKRGFFGALKKRFPRKTDKEADEVPEEKEPEPPMEPIPERPKPVIPEEISTPIREDPVKAKVVEKPKIGQPPVESKKQEKVKPAPDGSQTDIPRRKPTPLFEAPETDGKKEKMNLRQIALRRREKRIIKNEERRKKMEHARKKMVVVSDKLKLKKEMATENERHIIDNLAYSGVELAPIYKRLIAYILDNLIIIILTAILMVIIPNSVGWWLIFYILVGIVYFWTSEAIFGRGLGKKILKIYVTNLDFEYAGIGNSFVQCFIKPIPLFNIVDGVFALVNPLTKQRLSNKWSSTIVINGY